MTKDDRKTQEQVQHKQRLVQCNNLCIEVVNELHGKRSKQRDI